MEWLNLMLARLRGVLWPDAVHNDIDEELRCYIELEVEANIKRGITPEEARRQALKHQDQMANT